MKMWLDIAPAVSTFHLILISVSDVLASLTRPPKQNEIRLDLNKKKSIFENLILYFKISSPSHVSPAQIGTGFFIFQLDVEFILPHSPGAFPFVFRFCLFIQAFVVKAAACDMENVHA